jgi:hypothetical protein
MIHAKNPMKPKRKALKTKPRLKGAADLYHERAGCELIFHHLPNAAPRS